MTVLDHFEQAFPTALSKLSPDDLENLKSMPAISTCGAQCLKAIHKAKALDEMIEDSYGPYYNPYSSETLRIARIAVDLCNLYIVG